MKRTIAVVLVTGLVLCALLAAYIVAPLAWERVADPSRFAQYNGNPPGLPPAPPQPPADTGSDSDSHMLPWVDPAACDDLVRLESHALLGRLTPEHIACLEARYEQVPRQTLRKKISLLLIANANGDGDKRAWERLVRRHLEDIDQSDPNICYAYATHLARQGPGRALSVIRWSEVALENRIRWTGETRKTRVYNLHKLRAAAANSLWAEAEFRYENNPSDVTAAAVERTEERVMRLAREWYRIARTTGGDETVPLQLCTSAAGSAA